jgi:hypothetical protein
MASPTATLSPLRAALNKVPNTGIEVVKQQKPSAQPKPSPKIVAKMNLPMNLGILPQVAGTAADIKKESGKSGGMRQWLTDSVKGKNKLPTETDKEL